MEIKMNRLLTFLGLAALTVVTSTCGTDEHGNPIDPLKQLCGFTCPGDTVDDVKIGGVAEGNASISGISEVDAFFSATIAFQTAANGVSDGIQAQLDLIKADFGITGDLAAGLKTAFDANLEAGVKFEYQPARCAIDAQATLEASAKCDAKVSGGKAVVDCKGSCEAEVTAMAKCDASAELYCTVTAPEIKCEGECQGSCTAELKAAAKCDGTCHGKCDGTCSAFSDKEGTMCAGSCSGMCMGSCEAQLAASAKCEGTCRGECTAKPASAGCEGAVHAECRAKADATFKCEGQCTGDFEPPEVSAECKASAKAQASVNVECTPPRLDVRYAFKASADAKFKAALTALLDVRLPALLQASGKAKVVARAGEGLGVAATGAVKGAADTLRAEAKLKVYYSLKCALDELPKAKTLIQTSSDKLTNKLNDSKKVTDMLGLMG
jgi:hypothetical protein